MKTVLIKAVSLVVILALMVLAFAGCSKPADKDTIKIGVIQFAAHPSLDNCYNGFLQGLEAAGFKNGENIVIDFQNAQGQEETSDQLAKNMAAKRYDMLVGIATPSAMSAYAATMNTDIPTVFCAVSDPVGAKLVKSLEKPENNCTGTSDLLNLEAQLKLIRAFQPEAKKIGVLYTTGEPNSVSHLAEIKQLAPQYGFEIVEQGVQGAADIPQAAATLVTKVDCINNFTDNNVVNNLRVVLEKANQAGIPVYGSEIEQVKKGCLASESLDYVALGKQTGELAAKILNGAKASETPVVLIKDSLPVYNAQVLEQLGLTLPADYQNAEKITTIEQ